MRITVQPQTFQFTFANVSSLDALFHIPNRLESCSKLCQIVLAPFCCHSSLIGPFIAPACEKWTYEPVSDGNIFGIPNWPLKKDPRVTSPMKGDNVQDLLQQHQSAINVLWEQCADFKDKDIGVPLDEIFLMRFVLSNKNDVKLAGKKLRETLQWRVDNIDKLNGVMMGKLPYRMEVTKYIMGGLCGWFGDNLLFAARVGLADLSALMHELSANQVADFLIMSNEIHFRMVDERTRSTGVLCKMITIIDAYGFSLSRFSRKFMTALSISSHASNKYFPQLLRHTVFINLPSTVKMLFMALKRLLPASAVEKQRVCMGKPHSGQSAADCPFLRSKMKDSAATIAALPSFLGGEAKTPESLQHDEDM